MQHVALDDQHLAGLFLAQWAFNSYLRIIVQGTGALGSFGIAAGLELFWKVTGISEWWSQNQVFEETMTK